MSNSEELIRLRLDALAEPNKGACIKLLDDNLELFRAAPGSRKLHQAWYGGYLDHVAETFRIGYDMMVMWASRMELLPEEEQFWLRDVYLVMFLHDIEKPWKYDPTFKGDLVSKGTRKKFRKDKVEEYGIELEDKHWHALQFVEGMRDSDYSPFERVMSPFATFCHMCDLASARLFYDMGQW